MKNNIIKLTLALTGIGGWLGFDTNTALAQYKEINLVGYQPGMARFTDPKLNGWGMAYAPGGPFCNANTVPGVATFYDKNGKISPLVISIPPSQHPFFGPTGTPTGLTYNPTHEFIISKNGKSASAIFIFDALDGAISGWNPAVDPNNAVIVRDQSANGSVYSGLTLGKNSRGQSIIYAANFGLSRVDMFDGSFHFLGSFTDPNVATQYPRHNVFGVENEDGKLYVTFGAFDPPFGGVVDVFDLDGNLLTPNHFAANAPNAGPLVNPWAVTRAPRNFGKFSGALLIGNVEDGKIHAYNPETGALLGAMSDASGNPLVIPGLWDLSFGGGSRLNGRPNQLFFNAGPNAVDFAGNGLFGKILAAEANEDEDED